MYMYIYVYTYVYIYIYMHVYIYIYQGRIQNLKEVPQTFREIFDIDDVIQRNQHCKEKKINMSSILIFDVKLAS